MIENLIKTNGDAKSIPRSDGKSPFADAYQNYAVDKPSQFTRLLWWMAGADERLLAHSTHGDHVKFQCMGGIVASTALMAAFAGGYGFYTIFQPKDYAIIDDTHMPTVLMSVVFGIIWGAIILNIDRFIVAGSGKGDGTEAITRKEFASALPRIIMGAIIALTVSKPIEIRMFKSEIDQALNQKQRAIAAEYRQDVVKKYTPRFDIVSKKIEVLRGQLEGDKLRYEKLEDDLKNEMAGKESGIVGEGPNTRNLRRQIASQEIIMKDRKDLLQPEIDQAKIQHQTLVKEQQEEQNDTEAIAKSLDGLLERIKLSHEIAGWPISLFITLLFMAIELTPIFFKLMLIRSAYDYLDDGLKEYTKVKYGILPVGKYVNRLNGQEEVKYRHYESFLREMEQVKSLKAQRELMEYIARQWTDRMIAEAKTNPQDFEKAKPIPTIVDTV